MKSKNIAPRNKTIFLSDEEFKIFSKKLIKLNDKKNLNDIINKTICQDTLIALDYLPYCFVDLMIIDPPYNLNKSFNSVL